MPPNYDKKYRKLKPQSILCYVKYALSKPRLRRGQKRVRFYLSIVRFKRLRRRKWRKTQNTLWPYAQIRDVISQMPKYNTLLHKFK